MPRIHDLENHFNPLPRHMQRQGRLELTDKEFFTSGKSVFDFPRAQFEYSPARGQGIIHYANASVDPAYEWIDRNAKHSWHWYECECNHGHSMTIHVWFESEEDALQFNQSWTRYFKRMT